MKQRPPLLAFLKGDDFNGRLAGERVLLLQRRHPLFLLRSWVAPSLLLMLTAFLTGLGLSGTGAGGLLRELGVSLAPAFFLWGLGWGLVAYLEWENDRYLVTDRRVIAIRRVYRLFEEQREAELSKIQDITVTIPGLMAHWFDYGDLLLATAGTAGGISCRGIATPQRMKEAIFQQQQRLRETQRRHEQEELRQRLQLVLSVPTASAEEAPAPVKDGPSPGSEQGASAPKTGWVALAMAHLLPLRPLVEPGRVIYHRHWLVLVRSLLFPGAVGVGVLLLWTTGLFPQATQVLAWSRWVTVLLAVGSGLPLLWLIWRYEDWRNDIYVITEDRLIDVKRLPFRFRAEVKEAPLANIQNLTLRIPSFLAASLDYGDIEVDTAGREGSLVFRSIHHPHQVSQILAQRIDRLRERRRAQEGEQREEELLHWFAAYNAVERQRQEGQEGKEP